MSKEIIKDILSKIKSLGSSDQDTLLHALQQEFDPSFSFSINRLQQLNREQLGMILRMVNGMPLTKENISSILSSYESRKDSNSNMPNRISLGRIRDADKT